MELYIRIELQESNQSSVLIVPEHWEQTSFTFKLPVFYAQTNDNLSVNLIITAINIHDNTNSLTKTITVNNTVSDGFRSTLYETSYDYANMSSLTLLSSQMELILETPTDMLYGRVCKNNDQ